MLVQLAGRFGQYIATSRQHQISWNIPPHLAKGSDNR